MKRKKRKRKTLANGKIIITDFRGIDPEWFITDRRAKENIQDEVLLVAIDGRLFIDSRIECADELSDMFSVLMSETRDSLGRFREETQKCFWWVRTIKDCQTMHGSSIDRARAFYMLLVPFELQRREIENAYFQKNDLKKCSYVI